jgi:hypothetical protein
MSYGDDPSASLRTGCLSSGQISRMKHVELMLDEEMGTGWFFDRDKVILVFLPRDKTLTRRNVGTSKIP